MVEYNSPWLISVFAPGLASWLSGSPAQSNMFPSQVVDIDKTDSPLLILISPPPPPPLLTPTPRPRYLNKINQPLKCLTLQQTTFQYKIQLDNRKGKDTGSVMDWILLFSFPSCFHVQLSFKFYGNISHRINSIIRRHHNLWVRTICKVFIQQYTCRILFLENNFAIRRKLKFKIFSLQSTS